MTTPPTPQPKPAPLPERVQEMLAATEGHTAGPWTYSQGSICHGYEIRNGMQAATWIAEIDHENREDYAAHNGYHLYSPQADRDAALIAAAPTLRALLAETAAALAAAEAERDALRAALGTVLSACELQQTDYPECRAYMTLSMADFETARAALGGQS